MQKELLDCSEVVQLFAGVGLERRRVEQVDNLVVDVGSLRSWPGTEKRKNSLTLVGRAGTGSYFSGYQL